MRTLPPHQKGLHHKRQAIGVDCCLRGTFLTVALLVTTVYFLMGGIPRLVLDHETSLDARFIRGFFNVYRWGAFATSVGAAVRRAFLARPGFAIGASALALVVVFLRGKVFAAMGQLSNQILRPTIPSTRADCEELLEVPAVSVST